MTVLFLFKVLFLFLIPCLGIFDYKERKKEKIQLTFQRIFKFSLGKKALQTYIISEYKLQTKNLNENYFYTLVVPELFFDWQDKVTTSTFLGLRHPY